MVFADCRLQQHESTPKETPKHHKNLAGIAVVEWGMEKVALGI